jgi:hypothetical protein
MQATVSSGLGSWQSKAVHTVTAPSGQRLRIRIPGVGTLLEKGEIPASLTGFAVADLVDEQGAAGVVAEALSHGVESDALRQRILEFASYQKTLVAAAVVAFERPDGTWEDVSLTLDQMADLPEGDLSMVAELVQRLRGTDARGVSIGVEPLDRWEMFREVHGCTEDCESCQRLVDELSTSGDDEV